MANEHAVQLCVGTAAILIMLTWSYLPRDPTTQELAQFVMITVAVLVCIANAYRVGYADGKHNR